MYDVIILGTGPAGYTAALYTSRAFLKTLVFSGPQLGGQLTTTTEVENYPGFEKGIQGPELMEIMKKQVERFGAQVQVAEVTKVDFTKQPFTVFTAEASFQSKTVIIATGATAKYLGLTAETKFAGKGVSACATCDGFFFKDKDVMVIGGGDTAMEEATFLTRFAKSVTIVHRRQEFRASPIMLERAQKNPKITFLTNKIVTDLIGETSVTGAKLKDAVTGEEFEKPIQGFFLAIGHKPNTDFLKGSLDIDGKGYIRVEKASVLEAQTKTSIDGVFAAGDCVDPRYRQAVVAAGQGCQAAVDAQKFLEEE
ncbi:thioredoxin-disulfide reductase [Candidatus Microgenomates bacterium]|nr:MAG: thioredoxin-disulfide reductase [Candidatus Microgenomates bacterium]